MFRRLPLVFGAALAALVAVACGSATDGGLQQVRDSERQIFFEIPSGWSVYHSEDLAGVAATPFVAQDSDLNLPVFSRVVFQGAGVDAGIPAANTSDREYPVGAAVVRSIPASLRDQMSRYWLAELVVPYHSHPVAQEQVKDALGGGFDGVQVLVVYNDVDTETDAAAYLVSVTDPEVEFMYTFAIGCSLSCFNTNVEAIVAAIDSWLVNTR